MPQLGQPGQIGTVALSAPGTDTVDRRLRELERKVSELVTARSGDYTTIAGLLKIIGQIDVTGTATFEGDTTIGGNLVVDGTLSLPAGIIDNAALTDPVAPKALSDSAGGFALSTTAITSPCSVTFAVPAGFSTALVIATSDMTVDSSVASDASVRTDVDGNHSSFGQSVACPASVQVFVSNTFSFVLTGLGASFVVSSQVAANGANIPGGGGTWMNLNAFAVFLR